MTKDLISLIIPVYNGSKYILQTMDSILAQDYPNLEIIVINDGSTDDTLKKLEKYKNKITVFTQENGGISNARRTGVSLAKGEYIVFSDSDDILTKDCISYLYGLVKKYGTNFAKTNLKKFYNDERIIEEKKEEEILILHGAEKILKTLFSNKDISISLNATIFHNSILKKIKIKDYTLYEDAEILAQAAEYIDDFVYSSSQKYFYRQHKDSAMHSSFSHKNIETFNLLNDIETTIKRIAPAAMDEFNYYRLCVICDQYKYLAYSDYPNKKEEEKHIKQEYRKSKKLNYNKQLVTTRQKVLWPLTNLPISTYKTIINIIRKFKKGE